jgi:hypothetical protein
MCFPKPVTTAVLPSCWCTLCVAAAHLREALLVKDSVLGHVLQHWVARGAVGGEGAGGVLRAVRWKQSVHADRWQGAAESMKVVWICRGYRGTGWCRPTGR